MTIDAPHLLLVSEALPHQENPMTCDSWKLRSPDDELYRYSRYDDRPEIEDEEEHFDILRRHRQARPPIFGAVTGSAADILMLMFGPPQHDNHVMRWRWHLHQKRFP